ncbi:hypothetical protein Pla52n_07550 [Stieleria varia]|uniref:Uncharacterized protein n=2 Tax=Stieleria varia TaxID=2528005 RepID=A0A5C6B7X4_9BACT|nr:hypothetical protein Pla52n_07550 [Stieleria varia]
MGFPRLNGFALGVRDGLVLSIPFMAIVASVAWTYSSSTFSILRSVVVIPMIWAPCSGIVAEIKYRRRVPNSSERRWIHLPDNGTIVDPND